MTPGVPDDPMFTRLRALPRVTPDHESSARIRARSRAALTKPRQCPSADRRFRARFVDGAFVLVSLVYLSGAVAQAWRLLSGLR